MFNFLSGKKKKKDTSKTGLDDKIAILKSRIDTDPIAGIALNTVAKTEKMINHAIKGDEIIVRDMYEANRIPLSMLKPGDDFFGISSIINPIDWAHDEDLQKYKATNQKQAQFGVNIERTFLLQNTRDIDAMRTIMDEQSAWGIKVRYVLEDDLKSLSHFPDFTIMPRFDLAIYVPDLNNLTICVAARDKTLTENLLQDYEIVKRYATIWNYNE